jgi:hypothetical protein
LFPKDGGKDIGEQWFREHKSEHSKNISYLQEIRSWKHVRAGV